MKYCSNHSRQTPGWYSYTAYCKALQLQQRGWTQAAWRHWSCIKTCWFAHWHPAFWYWLHMEVGGMHCGTAWHSLVVPCPENWNLMGYSNGTSAQWSARCCFFPSLFVSHFSRNTVQWKNIAYALPPFTWKDNKYTVTIKKKKRFRILYISVRENCIYQQILDCIFIWNNKSPYWSSPLVHMENHNTSLLFMYWPCFWQYSPLRGSLLVLLFGLESKLANFWYKWMYMQETWGASSISIIFPQLQSFHHFSMEIYLKCKDF